jgi:hypothetical protein
MPFQPGQIGNPTGTNGNTKDWAGAIKRALARKGEGDYHQGLNKLADALLVKAEDGDMAALKEVGDRLDGKPAQTLEGNPDAPLNMNIGWMHSK